MLRRRRLGARHDRPGFSFLFDCYDFLLAWYHYSLQQKQHRRLGLRQPSALQLATFPPLRQKAPDRLGHYARWPFSRSHGTTKTKDIARVSHIIGSTTTFARFPFVYGDTTAYIIVITSSIPASRAATAATIQKKFPPQTGGLPRLALNMDLLMRNSRLPWGNPFLSFSYKMSKSFTGIGTYSLEFGGEVSWGALHTYRLVYRWLNWSACCLLHITFFFFFTSYKIGSVSFLTNLALTLFLSLSATQRVACAGDDVSHSHFQAIRGPPAHRQLGSAPLRFPRYASYSVEGLFIFMSFYVLLASILEWVFYGRLPFLFFSPV